MTNWKRNTNSTPPLLTGENTPTSPTVTDQTPHNSAPANTNPTTPTPPTTPNRDLTPSPPVRPMTPPSPTRQIRNYDETHTAQRNVTLVDIKDVPFYLRQYERNTNIHQDNNWRGDAVVEIHQGYIEQLIDDTSNSPLQEKLAQFSSLTPSQRASLMAEWKKRTDDVLKVKLGTDSARDVMEKYLRWRLT